MKLAMLATERLASSVPAASRSRTWPVRSTYRSRIVHGPSRQVCGLSSSTSPTSSRSFARELGGDGLVVAHRPWPRCPRHDLAVSSKWPVEPCRPVTREDLERVEPPRARGHHPHERDVVLGVRDRPQALLEVPDLRRLEQRQAADDGVRDVLVAQPRDDGVAVLVLAIQDGDVRPGRRPVAAVATARTDASTIATASSSGPAQTWSSTGTPAVALGPQALVGLVAGLVAARSAGWRRSGRGRRSGSSARSGAASAVPGARPSRIVGGRPREPLVELGEGGEAGAPEAVDRLVVVAHDHHVVRPVRRAAEQLDELDLGDVGVLELVDQDVPELALPAAEDVGRT